MSGCVAEADRELTVWQALPVEVVAAGLVGGLVPTGDFEVVQLWRFRRQQILLDRTCDIEVVIDLREFGFESRFPQGSLHVTANLAGDQRRNDAAGKNQCGVNDIDSQRKCSTGDLRSVKSQLHKSSNE